MKLSMEYCALHYLNMWLKHDRIYYEALNNGPLNDKLEAIKGGGQQNTKLRATFRRCLSMEMWRGIGLF
jgi:hypothetical protein